MLTRAAVGLALLLSTALAAGCLGPAESGSTTPVTFGPDAGRADWWVDPADLPLPPDTQVVRGFLEERACASRQSPEGRILGPKIEYRADAIIVTYAVREIGGTCPSNPRFPITIHLTEPLGGRALFDGGVDPPRDATIDPTVVLEPTVNCGPLVGTDDAKVACLAMLSSTLGDRYSEFATVRVEPSGADCQGNTCTRRPEIEARSWTVIATDLNAANYTWTCSYREEAATCATGPE